MGLIHYPYGGGAARITLTAKDWGNPIDRQMAEGLVGWPCIGRRRRGRHGCSLAHFGFAEGCGRPARGKETTVITRRGDRACR